MTYDTTIFWKWFEDNNERLTMLSEYDEKAQEQLLDEMQKQLEKYCPALSFEMSEPTNDGRRVVFTAEGDIDYFEPLLKLTDEAPDLDWWEFVPFKQPNNKVVKMQFDKFHFDTKKMYFAQIENEEEPEILALLVAFDGADNDNEDMLVATYSLLEAIVGEFDCATLLGYFEICHIPNNPRDEGFKPLSQLPDFVEWFKQQRDKQ
ncbi:MAG: hypothetical protein IKX51_06440 [Bacteroidales bacterium]|nr:hypothetical protein [Bacteroidales bacterium]